MPVAAAERRKRRRQAPDALLRASDSCLPGGAKAGHMSFVPSPDGTVRRPRAGSHEYPPMPSAAGSSAFPLRITPYPAQHAREIASCGRWRGPEHSCTRASISHSKCSACRMQTAQVGRLARLGGAKQRSAAFTERVHLQAGRSRARRRWQAGRSLPAWPASSAAGCQASEQSTG